jgi:hypothetical protein
VRLIQILLLQCFDLVSLFLLGCWLKGYLWFFEFLP